jgi:hypothetical protein
VDSSEDDWAETFSLINEPRTAQVARNSVTEKSARRVAGAIGLEYLEVGRTGMRLAAAKKAGLPS